MAVPKKKTSTSRRNQRRAHDFERTSSYGACQNCGNQVRPHHLCASCGHYNKRSIVTFSEKTSTEE